MKNILPPLLLLCASCISIPVQAQQAPVDPVISAEFSSEQQRLSNGFPEWQERSLRLAYQRQRQMNAEVSLLSAERFGLLDRQISAQYGQALDEKLYASVDASYSPEHQYLPQRSLGGMLQYEFAPSWLVHGGGKSLRYDAGTADGGTLMLEHYFASFSWALAWRPTWVLGTQTSSSELRLGYYPGETNAMTLSLSSGQVPLVAGTALLLVDVQSAVLGGRYWFTPRWSASYALNSTQVTNLYTRTGIRAGVQYAF